MLRTHHPGCNGNPDRCLACWDRERVWRHRIGWAGVAVVVALGLALVLGGCAGLQTCDRAKLALWQDLSGKYRATLRCSMPDGTHTDHDVLTSSTPIEAPQCRPSPSP